MDWPLVKGVKCVRQIHWTLMLIVSRSLKKVELQAYLHYTLLREHLV